MDFKIGCIPGDGIGPEIVREARKVLDAVGERFSHRFVYTEIDMGGCSIDKYGIPLTDEAIKKSLESDAVLMGSVGGNTATSPWYKLPPEKRPEAGLLGIRKALKLFANLRPSFLFPELKAACPLREQVAEAGFDFIMVRELTGGLYFGERYTKVIDGKETAVDTLIYNEDEIRRVSKKAFEIAEKRRKKVTLVDKANVLDSSRLWRKITAQTAAEYPDIELDYMLVDNAAMQIVKDPAQFDVVLTENMFGDILSDEAAQITGSIGMLPSASLNETKFGLYEPSGGSAPDIAGLNIANPIATVLSAAMMLKYSFDLSEESAAVEEAVKAVMAEGIRTGDIMSEGCRKVSTSEMGDYIAGKVKEGKC
ncbi:MAG: 3-isopropylmalate dehydrogenase [Lachnospiraceae bacterium]|nr:3-isopropylmalate dehydrogenase [Lachnospiraceae bacterium]